MTKLLKFIFTFSLFAVLSLSPSSLIYAQSRKEILSNHDILYQNSWIYQNNQWYYLDHQSKPIKNQWLYWQNNWYYLDENGIMLENQWLAYGNHWYYLSSTGAMVTAPYLINGELEGFDSQGHWTNHTYVYRDVPIVIRGKSDVQIIHTYLRQLETLPDKLTTLPSQYIFSDEFEVGTHAHRVGYIESTFKTSWLSKSVFIDSITITSLEFHKETLLHELAHAMDILTHYKLSNDPQFIKAIQLDEQNIQSIAYSHEPEEYFAYLTVDYFKNPIIAHQKYPYCANYIKEIFKDYKITNDYILF